MAQAQGQYHRPIGVTVLAVLAGLAALAEIWRMLVFLGIVNFTFVGKTVAFPEAQWGQAFWALILAAIWVWVAMGFWNVRAYAAQFGIFISLFTLIFGFMALLFGSSMEAESIPWLLAGAIFLYLSYPGVQQQFVEHELELMTPAQRAAVEQMQAANAALLQAQRAAAAPAAAAPAPAAPAAPAPAAAPPLPRLRPLRPRRPQIRPQPPAEGRPRHHKRPRIARRSGDASFQVWKLRRRGGPAVTRPADPRAARLTAARPSKRGLAPAGYPPSSTSYSVWASRPCASRCTRVAVSRSGASTRQKTLPFSSSTQYCL